MSPLARELLGDLPPVLRGDPSVHAAVHVQARQAVEHRALLDRVRANVFPQSADEMGLPWHELMMGITVAPVDKTVVQRQEIVTAVYKAVRSEGSGADWETFLRDVAGPEATYQEHVPGDPDSPPEYTVRVFLPFPPESDNYARVRARLREVLPANTDLVLVGLGGFILDESQLDSEGLGV